MARSSVKTKYNRSSLELHLQNLEEYPPMSPEEELETAILVTRGDNDAREKMGLYNQRLVVSIAKKYVREGAPLEDLIGAGHIGLMKAVDKFDPYRGNRFSTYATWWIRQSVTRAVPDLENTVQLTDSDQENIKKLDILRKEFIQENHCEPTYEELAECLEWPVNKVMETDIMAQKTISIEGTKDQDDDKPDLIDIYIDSEEEDPETVSIRNAVAKELDPVIQDALMCLNEREEQIIRQLYGYGCEQLKITEIARNTNLSRERIAQIARKAKRRMANILKKKHAELAGD